MLRCACLTKLELIPPTAVHTGEQGVPRAAAEVETGGFRSKDRKDRHGDCRDVGVGESEGSGLTAPCVWVAGRLSRGWGDTEGAIWTRRPLWGFGRRWCAWVRAGGHVQTPREQMGMGPA